MGVGYSCCLLLVFGEIELRQSVLVEISCDRLSNDILGEICENLQVA